MKNLFILFSIILVSGCATIPSNAPTYSPAPMAESDKGVLYIYRLGAYPKKRTPNVFIDGKKIIKPPEKSYTWLHLSGGEHEIKIDWPWDTGWPDITTNIPIKAGEEHFIKITGHFKNYGLIKSMGSEALLVEKTKAESELKECCKYLEPLIN